MYHAPTLGHSRARPLAKLERKFVFGASWCHFTGPFSAEALSGLIVATTKNYLPLTFFLPCIVPCLPHLSGGAPTQLQRELRPCMLFPSALAKTADSVNTTAATLLSAPQGSGTRAEDMGNELSSFLLLCCPLCFPLEPVVQSPASSMFYKYRQKSCRNTAYS